MASSESSYDSLRAESLSLWFSQRLSIKLTSKVNRSCTDNSDGLQERILTLRQIPHLYLASNLGPWDSEMMVIKAHHHPSSNPFLWATENQPLKGLVWLQYMMCTLWRHQQFGKRNTTMEKISNNCWSKWIISNGGNRGVWELKIKGLQRKSVRKKTKSIWRWLDFRYPRCQNRCSPVQDWDGPELRRTCITVKRKGEWNWDGWKSIGSRWLNIALVLYHYITNSRIGPFNSVSLSGRRMELFVSRRKHSTVIRRTGKEKEGQSMKSQKKVKGGVEGTEKITNGKIQVMTQ